MKRLKSDFFFPALSGLCEFKLVITEPVMSALILSAAQAAPTLELTPFYATAGICFQL